VVLPAKFLILHYIQGLKKMYISRDVYRDVPWAAS